MSDWHLDTGRGKWLKWANAESSFQPGSQQRPPHRTGVSWWWHDLVIHLDNLILNCCPRILPSTPQIREPMQFGLQKISNSFHHCSHIVASRSQAAFHCRGQSLRNRVLCCPSALRKSELYTLSLSFPGNYHLQNKFMIFAVENTWTIITITLVLEKWRLWLERAELPFTVLTDHKKPGRPVHCQTPKLLISMLGFVLHLALCCPTTLAWRTQKLTHYSICTQITNHDQIEKPCYYAASWPPSLGPLTGSWQHSPSSCPCSLSPWPHLLPPLIERMTNHVTWPTPHRPQGILALPIYISFFVRGTGGPTW